jgi:hypothetical protein
VDYDAEHSTELTVREGDVIRVYKNYNHWKYVEIEASGERGWIPGWYVSGIAKDPQVGVLERLVRD